MESSRSLSSPARMISVVTPPSSPQISREVELLMPSRQDEIIAQQDSEQIRKIASEALSGGGSSFGVGDINRSDESQLNEERKKMKDLPGTGSQKQKLLGKSSDASQSYTHAELAEMFSQQQATNLRILEALAALGQGQRVQQEHLEPVPEQQQDITELVRNLNRKLNTMGADLAAVARQQHLSEIRNATNTQSLLQGQEQIKTGVQQTNEGIGQANESLGRVEEVAGNVLAGVGRVEVNVEAGREEGRLAAAAAAAQLGEARQFMETRFNDVIKSIKTGLRSNDGCSLVYNEGYGMWLNSLLWCIWVFLRNCYALIQFTRDVYLGIKEYILRHIPDPFKTGLTWIFTTIEWLVLWFITNKIALFFGFENFGVNVVALACNFILDSIWYAIKNFGYVFKLLFGEEEANILWEGLKKNKLVDFLLNLITTITKWIYEILRDALWGKGPQAGGQPYDEDALVLGNNFDSGLYSETDANALLMQISNPKNKDLINKMQNCIDSNYDFLNKFTDYIYNMLLGQQDKTFCQFVSTNPANIVEFRRSIISFDNLMYTTFIGNKRIINSPNITELSAGGKRTKRKRNKNKNIKYKKITSKLIHKKTQKRLKRKLKNKHKSKK